MIKIYNSLTKKKEEFKTLTKNLVRMYTCGVTSYDDCHLGHGRSLYVFDVIARYLEHKGYQVIFVRNITDIDDKIIQRARELKISWQELSDKYIARYRKDLINLELKKVDFEPKATENIKDMIEYIKKLIAAGYGYATEKGVYFEVRKFKGYGKLSGQKIDDMKDAVRIEPDQKKKDPLDFALWKITGEDEPGWMSPWGKGRPGWHIECSVMSQKYLKQDTLDIHGGGRDLIFPHHENECAQSSSLSGKNLANYWLHHGLLTIGGQKMSKSSGNFVTLADVLKTFPADALKFFYLQAHYSSLIDFSWEKIKAAQKAYQHIKILKDKLDYYCLENKVQEKEPLEKEILIYRQKFAKAMDDDFNMPQGLAVLFELINQANRIFSGNFKNKDKLLFSCRQILSEITKVFGFSFYQKNLSEITDEQINDLIKKRNQHRAKKEFLKADQIRNQLWEKGVILEDNKEETVWRRK